MPEMIAGARWYLDVAPPPVIGGGVLSVANVIDNADPHAFIGAEYSTDACAEAEEWTEWCTITPPAPKFFDTGWDLVQGDPFAVYAGVECQLTSLSEAKGRAEARLAYGESRLVDYHVARDLAAAATTVDLGGPMRVTQAIGWLEAFAATIYGGQPTLLVPRQFMPCAIGSGAIATDADRLVTPNGSAVGAVTTPITLPMADLGTVYVTGQITLLRSAVRSFSTPSHLNGVAGAPAGAYAPPRALAERIYVPLIECFAARIQVTCS